MTLMNQIDRYRAMRVRQKSRYWQAIADIPAALYPYWKRTALFEFKGIPQDAFFFARATEGLLTFFDCVAASGRPCALPSAAADSVWHAWIALDKASLDAFCMRHFGKEIPHVEAGAMSPQWDFALANCVVAALRAEGRNPVRMRVPRLFALDRELKMPRGFGYVLDGGRLAFQRLDYQGRPEGTLSYPDGLSLAQLQAAGLVTQAGAVQGAKRSGGDGGGCGSSCCGDGGGCGSSCGGGCGGD